MNLLETCTNNEIVLLEQAGIQLENKNYTNEELGKFELLITDYIMSHSSKNGDIGKLQNKYESIYKRICG